MHFRYLLPENGGALTVADSMDEHVRQLREAIAVEAPSETWRESFLAGFVRPQGLDAPAASLLVDDLERLGSR